MTDVATVRDLQRRGTDVPAPEAVRVLYRSAFRDFGLRALWSSRAVEAPMIADALAITESLRVEGGVAGRRLAEAIISASRAAL
jgi:hypothetical protein